MTAIKPSARQILIRVALSLAGSYLFVWGFTALGVTFSVALGARYEEAERLFYLLAILIYLCCFFYAFAARRLGMASVVLVGGGAVMTGAATLLARSLVKG